MASREYGTSSGPGAQVGGAAPVRELVDADGGAGPVDGAVVDGAVVTGLDGATPSPIGGVLMGLRALSRAIDRYRHALGAEHGLGVAETITLAHLVYDEPATAGEIALRTGLTQGSVTSLLDRLETRGYLVRERPAHNRRTTLIRLTVAGRELATGMFEPLVPLLERAAGEPDAPDPERLAHCLGRIAELMESVATGYR